MKKKGSFKLVIPQNYYDKWALLFSEQLTRSVLKNSRIFFFNLNEVIRRYLFHILTNDQHWFTQLFSDPNNITLIEKVLPHCWFVTEVEKQGKKKVEKIYLRDGCFQSASISIPATPESIIFALRKYRFCPGLTLCFWILAFQNGIRCLGGFEQIEYLAELNVKLTQLASPNILNYSADEISLLTTGRCIDQSYEIYPIDVLLENSILPSPKGTFLNWLQPIFPRLSVRKHKY
jgi:hypothetical protein